MTIKLRGQLRSLHQPLVMGILNITPDSFYSRSRTTTDDEILRRIDTMLSEGADIIDVGACSTRPGSTPATADEEMQRLDKALSLLRSRHPEAIVSVDTFRADVAAKCVRNYGVDIVNDIGGGALDSSMFATVADLQVPYVLTHSEDITASATPVEDVMLWLARQLDTLHLAGVADVIVDPGFGFGKTLEQNYELLRRLADFAELEAPLLVGVSRKSMIYKQLECTPADALNGTTVLNTQALLAGANILRVHDVWAARQTVKLCSSLLAL